MPCPLDVFGTNGWITAGSEFRCPGRVSGSSEDVLDLGGLGQRMQVGGACRGHRCPRCLARSISVRALGCLESCPRRVAQGLSSPTTPSELPRGTDGVPRPRVVRLIGLEYLQHHFRARRRERGDFTQVLHTQSDLALVCWHASIIVHCAVQHGGKGDGRDTRGTGARPAGVRDRRASCAARAATHALQSVQHHALQGDLYSDRAARLRHSDYALRGRPRSAFGWFGDRFSDRRHAARRAT